MSRSDSEKVSKSLELYNEVLSIVDGSHPNGSLRNKYICYKAKNLARRLLRVLDEDVVINDEKLNMEIDIVHYLNYQQKTKKFKVTERKGVEIANYVFKQMPIIEEIPPSVRMKDDPGYCWHRIPYIPDPKMKTPLFDDFIERCSDGIAVKIFIGSLFFKDSDRQQYLWLQGSGQDGKGTLTRLLYKIFGCAFHSAVVPESSGEKRFFNAQLIGKRLAVFSDCEHPAYPKTGHFKTITGADPLNIDQKNKDPFTDLIDTKFIFTSNELLDLTDTIADTRRAIYSFVNSPGSEQDPTFEERFHAEGPGIIFKCIEAYQQNIVDLGLAQIPVSREMMDQAVSSEHDRFEGILESFFELVPIDPAIPKNQNVKTPVARFHSILEYKAKMTENKERLRFFGWLERSYPVEKTLIKNSKKQVQRVFLGIKERFKPKLLLINEITDYPDESGEFPGQFENQER